MTEIAIGDSLRELRRARRMTLKGVAEQAGISESFLSQVERGRSFPSLQALFRIAAVFNLTPGELLEPAPAEIPALMRRADRVVISIDEYTKERLLPPAVKTMQVLAGTFQPGSSVGEPYFHGDSDELLVVVRGAVRAEVDGKEYRLREGDTLYYKSSSPHTLDNVGDEVAEVLWIIAPPA
ncbi:MAG: XRE family transcriptional regulator [Candidatus Leucobacter sulfamidivorax]|nr:XRE family transcriptional regulator [Candidatus Leucobacter sulfamidivorax]